MGIDGAIWLLGIAVVAGFAALRPRARDEGGWWLGLLHGLVAVIALFGLVHASDLGFAVGMGLLAAFCVTMAGAQAARILLRQPAGG